eukprot:gene1988-4826_t
MVRAWRDMGQSDHHPAQEIAGELQKTLDPLQQKEALWWFEVKMRFPEHLATKYHAFRSQLGGKLTKLYTPPKAAPSLKKEQSGPSAEQLKERRDFLARRKAERELEEEAEATAAAARRRHNANAYYNAVKFFCEPDAKWLRAKDDDVARYNTYNNLAHDH